MWDVNRREGTCILPHMMFAWINLVYFEDTPTLAMLPFLNMCPQLYFRDGRESVTFEFYQKVGCLTIGISASEYYA